MEAFAQQPISLMMFQNGGVCFAIVHAPVPRAPISFTLPKNELLQLRSSLLAAGLESSHASTKALAPAWQDQCARVFDLAFPDTIKQFLRDAAPGTPLSLLLTPELLDIPWEHAFDGKQFLATKFQLTRQLTTEENTRTASAFEPGNDRLQVLMVVDPAYYDGITAGLHARQESQMDAREFDLTIQRADAIEGSHLQRVTRGYSVIHFMGSVAQNGNSWSWAHHLRTPAATTIKTCLLDTNRVLEAAEAGRVVITEIRPNGTKECTLPSLSAMIPGWAASTTPHVIATTPMPDECRMAFALQLYASLAQGNSIGLALNQARQSLARHWALGWAGYQLYGNPALALRVRPSQFKLPSQSVEEYRQLTVMFCDLVNSTSLSEQLGLEAWQQVLQCYQRACATVLERHGGHVHEYKGDGLVVYFGFPIAYEDSARRAARAGLELARDFTTYFADVRPLLSGAGIDHLAVRVGIHTGRVVIGDVGGRATASGLTLAYTERLQQVAPPGRVVVSTPTQRLIEHHFRLTSLGPKTLKGIASAQTCYLVDEETDNNKSSKLRIPFYGREAEIAELENRWHHLKAGVPEIIHMTGEAGIGKSRLVRELRSRMRQHNAAIFECRCSPYLQNSALYPIIQGLRHTLGVDPAANQTTALNLIEANVPPNLRTQIVPAVAYLLEVPCAPRYQPLKGSLEEKRVLLREVLVYWLINAAKLQPFLLVVEDAQWSDPSTLEFLKRFSERLNAGFILVIITSRTEGVPWVCPFKANSMVLGRIDANAVTAMVRHYAGEQMLSDSIVKLIVERTDGVPLFIEESTKMAAESVNAGTTTNDSEQHEPIHIPPTIQDLLTARLDRLGRAKETAQVAAAVGREFSEQTLLAAADSSTATLTEHLSLLVDSEMMFTREVYGEKIYSFKHSLLREAAYTSMLSTKRRTLHGRIANVLAKTSAKTEEPELLAYHYTEAGDAQHAVHYWMAAGSQAKQRAGHAEAINHYRSVLNLIAEQRSTEAMMQTELSAQTSLANCIAVVNGYSSDEAGAAYARLEKLAIQCNNKRRLLLALLGLESFHMTRANFPRAYELAVQCMEMAQDIAGHSDDTPLSTEQQMRNALTMAQGSWVVGNVLFHQGKFIEATRHMRRVTELLEPFPAKHRGQAQDQVVMATLYQSWYEWQRGYPDRALTMVEKGVALAQECGHPFSLGAAYGFHASIHFFRREFSSAIERAAQGIAVCKEPGYSIWLSWSMILHGRATAEFPHLRAAGINEVAEGIRLWNTTGALITRSFNLTMLSEAYHADGRTGEALELLHTAHDTALRYGEYYYVPEILRLLGCYLLHQAAPRDHHAQATAKQRFNESIAAAKARGMRSSELRAVTDRSRLLARLGHRQQAADDLAELLDWFTDGFGTADLRNARQLHKNIVDETPISNLH